MSVLLIEKANSTDDIIKIIHEGANISEIEVLQKRLGINNSLIQNMLNIKGTTYQRRKNAGFFSSDETEKILRYENILIKAKEVFDNDSDTQKWLNTTIPSLNGNTPLEYSKTEFGARAVEELIGRLKYGVYS